MCILQGKLRLRRVSQGKKLLAKGELIGTKSAHVFSFLCLSIHLRKDDTKPFDALVNGMKFCPVFLGLGCIFMPACPPFFPELPFSNAQVFKSILIVLRPIEYYT